ncbi:MAG: DUF5130 domain-containing protein [Frankiaceae bacterium]|nr:DUF5130 domain-containing protein [Frankiaceae bacterium]
MSGEADLALRSGIHGGVRERFISGSCPAAPFTPRQLERIGDALTFASRDARLTFSLYVGELDAPSRATAEAMLGQLPDPPDSVLIAVSPGQRVVQVVTGIDASERISNRVCGLAVLAMRDAFSSGDLVGGVVNGVRILSDAAGRPAHHG